MLTPSSPDPGTTTVTSTTTTAPTDETTATAEAPRTWSIHVVADSDTRWKWGAAIASKLHGDTPAEIHGHLLQGRATPNDQQLADVGADAVTVRRIGIARLIAELADTDAQVIVLSCVGGTIQSLMHGLARAWEGRATRPVVVTGYVGLVYEKLIDGLLLRAGADILLANSASDARSFRDVLGAVHADVDSVVQTALPFLGGGQHDPSAAGATRPFTVTFVVQPSVPSGLDERQYALRQALEHARRFPDRHVILKLRGRVGEQTTHVERYHYADLLKKESGIPPNVEVAYGSMSDVLDRTDLCITISSTAALEAMHRSIPTAILTDFGVRETLGNHAFLHAHAYMSWQQLHDGELPTFDAGWAHDNGVLDEHPYDALREKAAQLVADPASLGALSPWFGLRDAAGYLPAMLERNGLRPDGGPLMGDPTWGGSSGFAREAMRKGARRVYQFSMRKFEPQIRKWAQL